MPTLASASRAVAGGLALFIAIRGRKRPINSGNGCRRRTRWIKGWMQTWLVHTRQPFRTLRDLGLWGSFGFFMPAAPAGFLPPVLTYPTTLVAS